MDAIVPSYRENGIETPEITQKIKRASQIFNLPQDLYEILEKLERF